MLTDFDRAKSAAASLAGEESHMALHGSGDVLARALIESVIGTASCNNWAGNDAIPGSFLASAQGAVLCPAAWSSIRHITSQCEGGQSVEPVEIFEKLLVWYEAKSDDKGLDPRWWFHHVIAGVVSDRAWVYLDAYLRRRVEWIESGPLVPVAHAIADELIHCAEVKGRKAAFGSARDAFGRLDSIFATRNLPGKSQFWLRQILVQFCRHCREPELTRGIAALIQYEPKPFGPYFADSLNALAALDEGHDREAILASVDAGQANWIRHIHTGRTT